MPQTTPAPFTAVPAARTPAIGSGSGPVPAPVPALAPSPATPVAPAGATPAQEALLATLQEAVKQHKATLVGLMQKVEEQGKRLQEAETVAKAAKDSAVRFFAQVGVPRLLGFNSIPPNSDAREDLACVQAHKGDWLPVALPVVYVARPDPESSSTVSDAWLRTFSVDALTLQVQEYWVRAVGDDGKTPAFARCTFHLPATQP